MRCLLIGVIALMMGACASIGRPEGGPRDETPPRYLRSNPTMGAVNVDRNRIELLFDENIQLDDPANKIVISPVQRENARINANGRRVTVDLRDTLRPATTYTIDFSDAIQDLNEKNILDGFAFDFATGPTLDSLTISGMVFQARNLEPAQGMVVGVYADAVDSTVRTFPFERIAKTNQLGQFTIRGLKPGEYTIFAVDDRNRDWHWDRSENIAFYPLAVSPRVDRLEVADTLRAADGSDSIVIREGWMHLPDDLLLTWFNEDYRSQYLRDNKRTSRRTVELKFGAPLDSMPQIRVANGQRAGQLLDSLSVLETRDLRDSLVYWLTPADLVAQDSLLLSVRYQKTDSLDRLLWQTDTLKTFFKAPKTKEKPKKKQEDAESAAADSIPPVPLITLRVTNQPPQDLNIPLRIESSTPLLPPPADGWRLEMLVDTLWTPVKDTRLIPDSTSIRAYNLVTRWEEGAKYRFVADSMAIRDIYGEYNGTFKHDFSTKEMADYGNIYLHITDFDLLPLDSAALYVELLNASDQPQMVARVVDGWANFHYVVPATYYARAYIDINGDSIWTNGNYSLRRLPEDVFYYPKKLTLRKNWDLEQSWALLDTPVDLQKPEAIKKNKPKTKGVQPRTGASDDEDEENANGYDPEKGAWGNGASYNNAGARSGSSGGKSTFRPGMAKQRTHQ